MNESAARKAHFPDLYGTLKCPGSGLRRKTSRGRSYGTIGARTAGVDHRASCDQQIAQLSLISKGPALDRLARRLRLGKKI